MKTWPRTLLVALVMLVVYQVMQLPELRGLYYRWDKLAHAAAFAAVYLALWWALRWAAWKLALLCAALGAAVEIHQLFLPGFTPSLADWAADLVGIALVWVASEWKQWIVEPNT